MTATIHVIDDDEKSRKLLRDVLSHLGYHVVTAANGPDAVDNLRREPPDLVLLDIQLPGLSGYEVLSWLRAQPGGASVPVFAVTASVMPQERHLMVAAGFSGYLPKPLSMRELMQTVAAVLPQAEPPA